MAAAPLPGTGAVSSLLPAGGQWRGNCAASSARAPARGSAPTLAPQPPQACCEDAAASSREAIRRNPRRLPPHLNLAFALADAGRLAEAREALSEAERVAAGHISPDAGALRTLAHLRVRLGASGPTPLGRGTSR